MFRKLLSIKIALSLYQRDFLLYFYDISSLKIKKQRIFENIMVL